MTATNVGIREQLILKRDKTRLAIKMNNCGAQERCALCGEWTYPGVGPELFLADSWEAVCHTCGEDIAPELMAGLRAAKRASQED